jgi:hypothetical protein
MGHWVPSFPFMRDHAAHEWAPSFLVRLRQKQIPFGDDNQEEQATARKTQPVETSDRLRFRLICNCGDL